MGNELGGKSLIWLIEVVVCLLAAPWVQLFAGVGKGKSVAAKCTAVSLTHASQLSLPRL